MRTIILLAALLTGLTCTAQKIDGTWIPVKQEMEGKPMPPAAMAHQELTLKDSTYSMTAESEDKGIVRYSGNKMDIYGSVGVNAGRHYTAIYSGKKTCSSSVTTSSVTVIRVTLTPTERRCILCQRLRESDKF